MIYFEIRAKLEALNEKLQVVGSLTRHDVRNKLMTVNTNAFLLRKKLEDQPELAKHIEGIESAVQQSNKLFEFSRLYERIGVQELSEINVEKCFNQAASLISDPQLKVTNECRGLTVTADDMLTQLFYNLLDNSLKHGKTVNWVILRYSSDNGNVHLYYEDNGVGIPIENKERIFAEGFTTGGSGLGLKLVRKMIEAYGWKIKEIGTLGIGVKFQITIPFRNSN